MCQIHKCAPVLPWAVMTISHQKSAHGQILDN
jgi:hypothetical protein